jgi:predicted nucleic acid-binding protein
MTGSWVCVDANIVVKLVVEEDYSQEARELWLSWHYQEYHITAPPLLLYEATSVLRKYAAQGICTPDESQRMLDIVLALDIEYLEPANFHQRALHLSSRLGQPAAYDAYYLALAEYVAGEFWTADKRLVAHVQGVLPWVKWLGARSVLGERGIGL